MVVEPRRICDINGVPTKMGAHLFELENRMDESINEFTAGNYSKIFLKKKVKI